MATHFFNNFKRGLWAGEFDLDTDTIRCLLAMSNTTIDTENDNITTLTGGTGFTTLDEMDGANYARPTLSGVSVTVDNTNDRGVFDANDLTFTALGAGTRSMVGVLIYKFVTNDAASIPLLWIEFASPVVADGTDFLLQWASTGIMLST